MEEKLAQYRALKAKEYEAKKKCDANNVVKKGLQLFKMGGKENTPEVNGTQLEKEDLAKPKEPLVFNVSGKVGEDQKLHFNSSVFSHPTFWKFVLWATLWGLFIELGFGAVYFVISISVILYLSMRSGSRKVNEPSAYSVFNPNCERLDGTFTAEQFERELRYGPASVH